MQTQDRNTSGKSDELRAYIAPDGSNVGAKFFIIPCQEIIISLSEDNCTIWKFFPALSEKITNNPRGVEEIDEELTPRL